MGNIEELNDNNSAKTKRPPNKICEYCSRKNIYPEKQGGKWVFPRILECFDCVMFHDYMFSEIRKHKPKKGNGLLLFPLTIFDITNNVMVGEYRTKEEIQYVINRYQGKERQHVKISVIHYRGYYDFTDHFI